MSCATSGVAVAVSARMGVLGRRERMSAMLRYEGRKS